MTSAAPPAITTTVEITAAGSRHTVSVATVARLAKTRDYAPTRTSTCLITNTVATTVATSVTAAVATTVATSVTAAVGTTVANSITAAVAFVSVVCSTHLCSSLPYQHQTCRHP